MIYDRLSNIEKYLGIHENLDLALTYIRDNLDTMPAEIELKDQAVRTFFNEYTTAPDEECFFEAHVKYADIHIMRSGAERVAVSNIDTLTVTDADPEGDFWTLAGPEDVSVVLQPGSFLLLLPGDAHKLKGMLDSPKPVTKTVFKVDMQ